MSAVIRLGVIGSGAHATELVAHGAPLGRIALAAFAGQGTEALAGRAGVPVVDLGSLFAGPGLRAVLVDVPVAERATLVAGALRAGKIVVCPPPVALTSAELEAIAEAARVGGGRLLCGGEIAHGEPGRRGLAAMAAPEFGPLRSLYLAIRQPRGGDGDVIETIGWEALDFVLSAVPGGIEKVRVNAGAQFGTARDTAVILLRTTEDAVITIELSRCLPASIPATGLGEVEIDAMGGLQALRITPQSAAVRIHRDSGTDLAPWLDAPVLAMLRAVVAACDGQAVDGIARARKAGALMERVRKEAVLF